MGIPDAAIIEPISVPKDLTCHICLDLAEDPVETGCHHIFCSNCIKSSREQSNTCPVDRVPLTSATLRSIKDSNPVLYRVWNSTSLRCPHAHSRGCGWTGAPSNLTEHLSACARSNASVSTSTSAATTAQINRLKDEIQDLKTEDRLSKELLEREQNAHRRTKALLQSAKSTIENLQNEKETCDPSYHYNIYNMRSLARLIMQNLDDKPDEIDKNKIFVCIQNNLKSKYA